VTDPELIKIRHNFARLPEGEVLVELQAVGRDWNFGMLGFHNVPVILNGSERLPLLAQRSEGLFSLAQHHVLCNRALFLLFCHVERSRDLSNYLCESLGCSG